MQMKKPNGTATLETTKRPIGDRPSYITRTWTAPVYVTAKRVYVVNAKGRVTDTFDRETGRDVGAQYILNHYTTRLLPESIVKGA